MSVQFKVDGANSGTALSAAPYAYSLSTTTLSNGNHLLSAVATDASGKQATSPAVAVKVNNTVADTTPPTVAMTAPANAATVSGTVSVNATATDNVSVATVQFQVDGANVGTAEVAAPYAYTWDTTKSTNGSHTLRAIATDGAGNSTSSSSMTVTVSNSHPDTTPPTVAMTAPASAATVSGTVSVTATATDNVSVASVQFQVDGANAGTADVAAPYAYTWDTTKATNGAHSLRAIATDGAGNSATSSAVTVTVSNAPPDTTPPTVSISTPVNGSTVSGTVTISANASDNVAVASVQFQLDGASLGSPDTSSPYTVSWTTTTASNGSHTLSAIATDKAGNSAKATNVTVTVNNTAPAPPPPSSSGNSIASLAGSMAPGSWAQLNTNNFQNGGEIGPPNGGSILEYNDRQVWNPVAQTAMLLGGSHSSSSTNCGETLFLQYAASNDTWSTLPNPCPNFDAAFGGGIGHAYDHNTINPTTGDFYHREYYSGKVMVFQQATQQWVQFTNQYCSGSSCQVAGALTYFPDRNSLVMLDGDDGVWEYALSQGTTGTWKQVASTTNRPGMSPVLGPFGSYHDEAEYSPACHCIILGGGNNSTTLYEYSSSGAFTSVAAAPSPVKIPDCSSGANGSIFTIDPVSGAGLVWLYSDGGSTVHVLDPVANSWSTVSVTSPIFPGPDGGVCQTAAIPISTYGVIMFVQKSSASGGAAGVWLYKHTTGAPASAPSLILSGVSANSITTTSAVITWTSSSPVDSQVDYGTTTAYGQSSTLNSTAVTNHSVALSGFTAGTLYHYRVKSHDSSGNLITSGDFTVVTASSASTTPPAVSVTSPASGATVSGSVTLAASATSSAGIASVYFRIDSAQAGSVLTASPFSVTWDTTTATNGAHTITAVAQDVSGNMATSSGVAVTVSNSSAPASSADYQTRCSAPGVVRCVGFDSPSDITGKWGDNSGILSGATTPMLDSTVKASGNSSLKFTIPPQAAADTSGSYFTNFSTDLSTQFGQNTNFYIQWRQRFSPEFLSSSYTGGEGWKQAIIGTGDITGCNSSSTSSACSTSCTDLEVVTLNAVQRGLAQMYDSCTGSTSHGAYDPFEQPYGPYDFKLQNAMPTPFCLYSQGKTSPTTYLPPTGNCFGYFSNEWMTFQVHIQTGPRVNDEFTNSYVQLWIAREGQPSQMVINWGPYNLTAGNPVYNEMFGKVWLLPYNTNKDPNAVYPTAYTWFDELIISTQKIADPQ